MSAGGPHSSTRSLSASVLQKFGAVLLLAAIVVSTGRLIAERRLIQLQTEIESGERDRAATRAMLRPGTEVKERVTGADKLQGKLATDLRGAAGSIFAPFPVVLLDAAFAQRHARDQNTAALQLDEYCNAFRSVTRALSAKPYDARLLVQWANVRQVLGGAACAQSSPKEGVIAALKLALQEDPTNMQIAYAGALIFGWSNNREEELKLLRSVVRYQDPLSEGQIGFILSEIRSKDDLRAVLVPRFPQVVTWAQLLRLKAPRVFERVRESLAELQQSAVVESEGEALNSTIPQELHSRRLLDLQTEVATDGVRRFLDGAIVRGFGEKLDSKVAAFLAARSTLSKLQIVRSTLEGDTRVRKSPLVKWDAAQGVAFDEYFRTIGFFLPTEQGVDFITLDASAGGGAVDLAAIRLFVSSDNQSWGELPLQRQPEIVRYGDRTLLVLIPTEKDHRFWKVHYDSSARTRSFWGDLDQLLQVYGTSARKEHDI